MTGNLILDSLISLAAIGLMVFAAWLAFRAPARKVDEAAVRARLSFDEPDFQPGGWLFDDEGRAALVEGKSGDFALVFRLGADLVTRRFNAGDVSARADAGILTLRPSDPGAGAVRMRSERAALWAHKIAGE